MKKNMKYLLVSAAIFSVLFVFAPASNAALILSTGPGTVTVPLPISGNDFNTDMQALEYSLMTTGAQLRVDQDGSVTFSYIAAESGFTDKFNSSFGSRTEFNGAWNFDPGHASLTGNVTAGVLGFNFTNANFGALEPVDNFLGLNLQGMGIFTLGSGSWQQVILGYDDQYLWPDDDNHDDMMVRVDFIPVNPVPVPASLWLFGSGLIGLIGIARQKKRND
jgi:hypothetical protein